MMPEQITLIRDSFAHLHRRKAETVALFYERLFAIAPDTRVMFRTDLAMQAEKLIETLTVAMATLNDREGLTILLDRLGRRHKGYGVEDRHYAVAREALLWTLRQSLGPACTPATERAWQELYDDIAGVMMTASREA
jgi:hemoglobin-like flavoprotein